MAERAGSDHRVCARVHRLLDRLDQLTERDVFARLDDRESAALDLGRVVDRLASAGLDDRLQRPGAIGILETEDLGGAQDLAPVERRDTKPLQASVRNLLQPLVAVPFGDQPEEVLDLDFRAVRRDADGLEIPVHTLAQVVVVRDPLAPVVTAVLNYRVGSNEQRYAGQAHALEHMMFRGSRTLGASQFSETTAITGGNFNADTQNEISIVFTIQSP